MSFSGLKTAVVNLAHHAQQVGESLDRASAGSGLRPGCQRYTGAPGHGGGEAGWPHRALPPPAAWRPTPSSGRILSRACEAADIRLYLPPLKLCGDNGAMIGAQGYYEYLAGHTAGMELNAYATRDIAD